jgi:hypothetical protein
MTLKHAGQAEDKIDMTERTISFTFVACSRTRTVYLFSLTFSRCLFSFVHPFSFIHLSFFSSYIYIHLPAVHIHARPPRALFRGEIHELLVQSITSLKFYKYYYE